MKKNLLHNPLYANSKLVYSAVDQNKSEKTSQPQRDSRLVDLMPTQKFQNVINLYSQENPYLEPKISASPWSGNFNHQNKSEFMETGKERPNSLPRNRI